MIGRMRRTFLAHPEAVGETYLQHMGVALRYSVALFGAAFCALVHALLPFLFVKTASDTIKGLHADMMRRGSASAEPTHARPDT